MSLSPPIRRLSTSSQREQDLINAYEAEEERIINVLSRKLEELREEKISLERLHEEESEAHVNRLARELAALRTLHQHCQTTQANTSGSALEDGEPVAGSTSGAQADTNAAAVSPSVLDPSTSVLLNALKKENETLRNRLATTERDYVRVTRLNEIYREELIQHRRRLGLSVDNLIGLSAEPYSQPLHRRNSTASSSPTASMVALPTMQHRPSTTHSIPVPRPGQSAAGHRGHKPSTSSLETPISHSPSSADSPFPFSPLAPVESYVSANTNTTTPPSSASLQLHPPAPYPMPPPSLSYPSVPPPSLSSSLGSPVISLHMPNRDLPSPVEPATIIRRPSPNLHRNSVSERRVVESGNLHEITRSRRGSVERGARVAETGSLIRNRAGSTASATMSTAQTGDQTSVFHPSLEETLE